MGMRDFNWMRKAECRDVDPELFFPDSGDVHAVEVAKLVCESCPVADQCLQFALESKERYGVWGGRTERERRNMHYRGTRRQHRERVEDERRIRELLTQLGPEVVKK